MFFCQLCFSPCLHHAAHAHTRGLGGQVECSMPRHWNPVRCRCVVVGGRCARQGGACFKSQGLGGARPLQSNACCSGAQLLPVL